MDISVARLPHAVAISELDSSCYKSNSLPLLKWKSVLSNPKLVTLVVGDLESPIAFVTLRSDGVSNYVLRLCVAEEKRGCGIATELVNIVGAKRKLYVKLREGNSGAISFLKKKNFKAIKLLKGEFKNEDGILFLKLPEEMEGTADAGSS